MRNKCKKENNYFKCQWNKNNKSYFKILIDKNKVNY